MDTGLSAIIQLNQFSTGRRAFTFQQVLPLAQKEGLTVLTTVLTSAVEADRATWAMEQKWAVQRRRGKLSQKQLKAQKALQQSDAQMDRSLTSLRDGAMSLIRDAGSDEQELIDKVEDFLDKIFPNGVQAITSLPYPMELTAVKEIVGKLEGDLAPVVTELGLGVQAARVAKRCDAYEVAQKGVEILDFGDLRAAREAGQGRLLQVVAIIAGTFYEPSGDHAKKRAGLLGPIMKQNAAISEHVKARRAVPDVNPDTGEEQPVEAPGEPEEG